MSNPKVLGGTFEDINEAVVKPVTDEVGKAIEIGVKSVMGTPTPTSAPPQDPSQAKLEDQKKYAEVKRKIDFWKKLDEEQKRIRDEQKQKQLQQRQVVAEEKQVKQFETVKKQNRNIALERAKAKTEIKGGVGG